MLQVLLKKKNPIQTAGLSGSSENGAFERWRSSANVTIPSLPHIYFTSQDKTTCIPITGYSDSRNKRQQLKNPVVYMFGGANPLGSMLGGARAKWLGV